jgi:hypothetical protein
MLGWDRYRFNKKLTGTRYAELVFLHQLGSVGHIVHSEASGARNIHTPFFRLRWDWYGFNKVRAGTHYAERLFLHSVGSAGHVMHSGVSGT